MTFGVGSSPKVEATFSFGSMKGDKCDVYLDYADDGYYLFDRNYPGIGIEVTVSF